MSGRLALGLGLAAGAVALLVIGSRRRQVRVEPSFRIVGDPREAARAITALLGGVGERA